MKTIYILYLLSLLTIPDFSLAEACAKKGQEAYQNPYQHPQTAPQCCKGLVPMGLFAYINGNCERLTGPSSPCMPCGDGACEYSANENICNCPKDCKTVRQECATEGQNIKIRNPLNIWSLEFLPLECCQGLEPETTQGDTATCKKSKNESTLKTPNPKDFGFWQNCSTDLECILVEGQPPCVCGKSAINAKFIDAYRSDLELTREILKREKGPGQYCEPCQPLRLSKPQTAKCINSKCRSLPSY